MKHIKLFEDKNKNLVMIKSIMDFLINKILVLIDKDKILHSINDMGYHLNTQTIFFDFNEDGDFSDDFNLTNLRNLSFNVMINLKSEYCKSKDVTPEIWKYTEFSFVIDETHKKIFDPIVVYKYLLLLWEESLPLIQKIKELNGINISNIEYDEYRYGVSFYVEYDVKSHIDKTRNIVKRINQ